MATSEEERAARNEATFREINERIKELNEVFDAFAPMCEWVCECADPTCAELISLNLREFEAVRQHPARFSLVPGHERLEIERVVERTDRYVVVEKQGAAGEIAERLAPS